MYRIDYFLKLRVGLLLLVLALFAGTARADIAYETALTWEADEATQTLLAPHADQAFLQKTDPVSSFNHLRRRANRDLEYFRTTLRALGFFASQNTFEVNRDSDPPQLAYTLVPGPRYTFSSFEFLPASAEVMLPELPTPEELGCTPGVPAVADAVTACRDKLLARLRAKGYPFAAVPDQQVVVDHATQTVRVSYQIDPGKLAVFGKVEISGLETVRPEVIEKEVPWEVGEPFDTTKLNTLRTRLYQRDLFSVARVQAGETVGEDGMLPVLLEIQEAKHHTISAGLSYRTDDGPGLKAFWEDLNRRGMGNKLRLSLTLSQRDMRFNTDYTIPRFQREDQALKIESEIGREDTDAYTSQKILGRAWVERRINPALTLSLGLGLRISQVEQDDETDSFFLVSTPFQWNYDKSNDKLDPTSGYRMTGLITPFLSVTDPVHSFLKADGTFTHYLGFGAEREWVLATRLRTGFIVGASRDDVPPDLLFYSGGGGSIRGYAYQLAGPLDEDDDPLGGRSVFETSVELRRKITEEIGMAVFVDGGTAFNSPFPDFSETILWAAGAGIRYYTPLGPLRADIAVPLNKRGVDDSFQFYISIGQAF
jgi:translocation and assembly module TamA